LGIAHFRLGDWKSSRDAFDKSMSLRGGGDSHDWFFLAMIHHHEGDRGEARKWYDRAVQWMEKHQPNNEELRRFRAEAEEILKINDDNSNPADSK